MYSILLLLVAAAGAIVALRGLPAWLRARSNLLLFGLLALAAATLETLLAGLGRWLGAGPKLLELYALPILLGTAAWPLSLFTMATLSRRLGHGWARIDWGHGAVCLFASALLAYGLSGIFSLRALQPACWQDVVWYLREVPPALACGVGPVAAMGTGPLHLVLPSVLVGWLGFGVALWRYEHRFGLLAAMAVGVVLLLAPAAWGPLPYYLGLVLCFAAVVVETGRHAGVLQSVPTTPEA